MSLPAQRGLRRGFQPVVAAGGEHAQQRAVGVFEADLVLFTHARQQVQALGIALGAGDLQQRVVGARRG